MAANRLQPGVRKARSLVQARLLIRVDAREWWTEVSNLSMSGVRAVALQGLTLDAGQPVQIDLQCDGMPAVALDGVCVRAGPNELAFRFAALDPPQESELRRVMRRCGSGPDGGE